MGSENSVFLILWPSPDWWTAVFTGLLVLITGLAVYFGGKAANAAAEAFRLESEPVLVFTDSGVPPRRKIEMAPWRAEAFAVDPTRWYILDIDINQRIYLRLDNHELNTTAVEPPGRYVEVRNVGRSPAVGITVRLHVYTGAERTFEQLESDGTNDLITIDAIASNSSYYFGVANRLGEDVRMLPERWATQVAWNKLGRAISRKLKTKPLPVVSETLTFKR
jgi:hypothetical protein